MKALIIIMVALLMLNQADGLKTVQRYSSTNATGFTYGLLNGTAYAVNYTSDNDIISYDGSQSINISFMRFNTSLPMDANYSGTTYAELCYYITDIQGRDDYCSGQGDCLLYFEQQYNQNSDPLALIDHYNAQNYFYGALTDSLDFGGLSTGYQCMVTDYYPNTENGGTSPYYTDYVLRWNFDLSNRLNQIISMSIGNHRNSNYKSYLNLTYEPLQNIIVRYVNPANNTILQPGVNNLNNSLPMTFNVTIRSNATLSNASLYFNFTGWAINQTIDLSSQNTYGIARLTFSLSYYPKGRYIWNVYACDIENKCKYVNDGAGQGNRTITFNRTEVSPPLPSFTNASYLNVYTNIPYAIKQNTSRIFNVLVKNESNLFTNNAMTCTVHIYDEQYTGEQIFTNSSSIYNGQVIPLSIPASVFSNKGHYSYKVQCNLSNGATGLMERDFYVNKDGVYLEENDNKNFINLSGLLILFLLGGLVFNTFKENE